MGRRRHARPPLTGREIAAYEYGRKLAEEGVTDPETIIRDRALIWAYLGQEALDVLDSLNEEQWLRWTRLGHRRWHEEEQGIH